MNRLDTIYIGYDKREQAYFDVLVESIKRNTTETYNIVPLYEDKLRMMGLYWRGFSVKEAENYDLQKFDYLDEKPFSTDFSFTRFLIPMLNQYEGLALYMDCDMFVRKDIKEIFELGRKDFQTPLWCVHHDYIPKEAKKMDNKIQQAYSKKNWSSFMLWNCDHVGHRNLTVGDVNTKTGWWLHNFKWLDEYTGKPIGKISPEWNWLDGHSSETIDPCNVHFTTGGPAFSSWTSKRDIEQLYVDEWIQMFKEVQMEEVMS
jgi:hypothetical protein